MSVDLCLGYRNDTSCKVQTAVCTTTLFCYKQLIYNIYPHTDFYFFQKRHYHIPLFPVFPAQPSAPHNVLCATHFVPGLRLFSFPERKIQIQITIS